MKYKNKPVNNDIEAFQYDGDFMYSDGTYYVPDWAVEALNNGTFYYDTLFNKEPCDLFIKTENGDVYVQVGEYIIRDKDSVKNTFNFYSCNPDLFLKNYEEVVE